MLPLVAGENKTHQHREALLCAACSAGREEHLITATSGVHQKGHLLSLCLKKKIKYYFPGWGQGKKKAMRSTD